MLDFHDMMIDSDLGSLSRRKPVYVLDSVATSLPASPAASITADGVSLGLGSRVLFTALTDATKNNMVYAVEGHSGALTLVLQTDGMNPSGAPATGEFMFVQSGTHNTMIYGWNGDAFARCDFQALASQTLAATGITSPLNLNGNPITNSVATVRVALTSPVTVTAADQIVITKLTSPGAVAVSLYASPATGASVTIKDGTGDAGTNHITITPAAGNIDGASTLVISTNYGHAKLVYNGTQWNQI